MAAVLEVKLYLTARRDLDITIVQAYFWNDSKIVLTYINNISRRFKVFVANRIAVIRDNSVPGQWKHVSGGDNPSDVISKGYVVSDWPVSWSRGALSLIRYKSEWRHDDEVSHGVLEGDLEVIRHNDQCVNAMIVLSDSQRFQHPVSVLTEHYSSFYRLTKALFLLIRFNAYLEEKVIIGHMSCSELRSSEQMNFASRPERCLQR